MLYGKIINKHLQEYYNEISRNHVELSSTGKYENTQRYSFKVSNAQSYVAEALTMIVIDKVDSILKAAYLLKAYEGVEGEQIRVRGIKLSWRRMPRIEFDTPNEDGTVDGYISFCIRIDHT